MSNKPSVAIIEDNNDLRDDILFFLQESGYSVWGCSSAELFWRQLHTEQTDIVLVDIGLPAEDGFSVIKHLSLLKKYGLIVITARGDQQDKLNGLQSGADLYLIKPINFLMLTEKIDSLWKRICDEKMNAQDGESDKAGGNNQHSKLIGTTNWQLDDGLFQLINLEGISVSLSPQEYFLLKILMDSPGQVFSKLDLHDILFDHVDDVDVHRIDVLLSRLRTKLKSNHAMLPIRTLFGKGLVFQPKS